MPMNTDLQRILVLAPHTDDGEWGAGASIARWIGIGHQVWYVAFSAAEESVLTEFPEDVLRTEVLMPQGSWEFQLDMYEFSITECATFPEIGKIFSRK